MDINGAKALRRRLGLKGADEVSPAANAAYVPADAPPIYRWTGVSKPSAESPSAEADEEIEPRSASLFTRLRLSIRY
jgi:hypothetical protein